jgi:hypothetical protein
MQHVPFAAYFFTQSFLLSFVSSFLRFYSLRKCCGWVWAKEREMSCRPLSNIFVSDFIAFFPQVLFSRNRLSADVVFSSFFLYETSWFLSEGFYHKTIYVFFCSGMLLVPTYFLLLLFTIFYWTKKIQSEIRFPVILTYAGKNKYLTRTKSSWKITLIIRTT